MRKKSATLTDIAENLKIDVSTVSKALKDHPKISEKTKKKVREVARQLNYRPNNIATALVKGRSNLVGVMVPYSDENFFAAAIRGIDDVLKNENYRVIIFQSYDNTELEIKNIETMLQTKVDGIIASHAMNTESFGHFQYILDQRVPLILFDRFTDKIDSDVVAIDDFKGAYKAVRHLIDQGCRNIALISGYKTVQIYKERLRGYKQALEEHNLPCVDENIYECDMSLECGRKVAHLILEEEILPDALFCSNDYTALGAIQVLKEEGIKIPEQVAIVGFSNEDFTSFVTPTITSVNQHSREMGKIAAQHFLDQASAPKETATKELPKKTILIPELVIKESSLKKLQKV